MLTEDVEYVLDGEEGGCRGEEKEEQNLCGSSHATRGTLVDEFKY